MNRYGGLRPESAWALSILILIGMNASSSAQDLKSLEKIYAPKLEKILKENIASFWYPKCLDRENGGYIISFGPQGQILQGGTKGIVTQSRMVWLFSRMAREGYSRAEYLEAADLGYRFLMERMWDPKNGGFYWEVDGSGDQKLKPMKHLYGQSFALYGISEYYLASKKPEVLQFAVEFFNLLDTKAHDKEYGGYIEFFTPDWKRPRPDTVNYMDGARSNLKLMNTHLHLLEAMTTFYRASRLPLARERLLELIAIESNSAVRKDIGACTDQYERNWTPLLFPQTARASYGHDLENIWLLINACQAANVPSSIFGDLFRTLFDYSLRYGYDAKDGGFYESGPLGKPADRLNKTWWVEAEVLVSSLYMFRMTGDQKYVRTFEETFKFVDTHQVDWKFGEWFETITPNGKAIGNKGHIWKAGYHNGRAMMECLSILKGEETIQ